MTLKQCLTPISKLISTVISSNQMALELYRKINFRGKLFLAQFLTLTYRNGIYKCGNLKYDLDFTDQIQEMIYLGIYERHEISFLKNYIQKGWVCLDVGSNIGFYTLNLASLVGQEGIVYAIEPSTENYRKLQINIDLNNLENCYLNNFALSSSNSEIVFSTSPDSNSGWGRLGQFEWAKSEVVVKTQTLDNFVTTQNIVRIDFAKVDIEGHEIEFIKGAEKTLKRGIIKRLMIEYSGFNWEPQGFTLRNFIEAITEFGLIPKYFNLAKIRQAQLGQYKPAKETLNLFFELSNQPEQITSKALL